MKPAFNVLLPALAAGASPCALAQSVDAGELARRFGALPAQTSVRLSPNGSKLAYLAAQADRAESLVVTDLATKQTSVAMSVDGKPLNFAWCNWGTDVRLVCDLRARYEGSMNVAAASRLLSVNADGSDMKLITHREHKDQVYRTNWGGDVLDWFGGEPGTILMDRWFVPVQRTGSMIESRGEGLGVERVDIHSNKRSIVEAPRLQAAEYITDGKGRVRIFGVRETLDGYSKSAIRYMYRTAGSNEWKPLGIYDEATRQGFSPYAVDGANNLVYGLKMLDGRRALYAYAIGDGAPQERLVYANSKVDVDGPARIGRLRRVIGARYTEEKPHIFYIDKDVEKMVRSLEKALPNAPVVSVIDVSDDGGTFLVHAYSDVEPGSYFLFDRFAKTLAKVLLSRPKLEGMKLAEQKPVQYRAADGTMIPAYLTLPVGSTGRGLPAIVMPHGGPSARDEWGFDWWAQFFAARGFAVLQPNYRGSDGYGEKWLEKNGLQSWRSAMSDVLDAGRWLISAGVADRAKLAVVGWSYGGYAALQTSMLDSDLFKAIVAVAPVTDFTLLREQYRLRADFFIARDFIGPDLKDGSPAQNAAKIKAPVMIFHPDQDQNVSFAQGKLMADRLKDAGKAVTFVAYPNLGHQLESSEARADMLGKTDSFLRATLKID